MPLRSWLQRNLIALASIAFVFYDSFVSRIFDVLIWRSPWWNLTVRPFHPLFVYDTTYLPVWRLVHRINSGCLHSSIGSFRYCCEITHIYTGCADVVSTTHHALCDTLLRYISQTVVIIPLVRCIGPLLITVSTQQGIRVPIVLERILIQVKASSHLLGNLGVHIVFNDWISRTVEGVRLLL